MNINIIMLIMGVLSMFLNKFIELKEQKDVKFSLGFWLKDNYLKVLLGAMVITAIYIGRDDVKDIFGFDLNNKWMCYAFGWGSQFAVTMLKNKIPVIKKVQG